MVGRSALLKAFVLWMWTFFLFTGVAAGVEEASTGEEKGISSHFGHDVADSKRDGGDPSVSVGMGSSHDALQPASNLTNVWNPLMERLASDGFDRDELRDLFSQPQVIFDRSPMVSKMDALYQAKLLSEIVRPIQKRLVELGYRPGPPDGVMGAETRRAIMAFQHVHGLAVDGKPAEDLLRRLEDERRQAPPNIEALDLPVQVTPMVYESVLQPERIGEARDFLTRNKDILSMVHKEYGVSPKVAVSLLALETRVGKYLGEKDALTTLSSMAMCTDFREIEPFLENQEIKVGLRAWLQKRCRQKADWAYEELKALLRYAKNNQLSLIGLPGSSYGAIGICQFMPTNALEYGVDGDGDGKVDLFEVEDALPSMGNFMRHHGWRKGISERKALYHYNHSTIYVNTILALADQL